TAGQKCPAVCLSGCCFCRATRASLRAKACEVVSNHQGGAMSPEIIAGWTLVGYLVLGLILVIRSAVRAPEGWQLWVLYVIAALYGRLGFRLRSNRPCPFLEARPALLIANHRGPVDPALIWIGVTNQRPLEFLTAREFFGTPGLQFIFDA